MNWRQAPFEASPNRTDSKFDDTPSRIDHDFSLKGGGTSPARTRAPAAEPSRVIGSQVRAVHVRSLTRHTS